MPKEIEDALDEDDAVDMSKDMKAALEAEQDESEDADADDQDADDSAADAGEQDADSAGDDSADDSAEDDEAARPRNKKDARARIQELAKLRRDAEASAFQAEMKNAALEAELERLRTTAATQPDLKAPDPKDFDYGSVDPAYLDALVEYRVKLREQDIRKETAQQSEKDSAAAKVAEYNKKLARVMEDGPKRYKDFEAVVNSTPYPAELAVMILDSENPIDIAYHLSNNVGELRALARADSAERARTIGRLEGRFSATSAVKKVTKAPDPLGSRTSRAAPASHAKYGPDSQDDFDKAFYGS